MPLSVTREETAPLPRREGPDPAPGPRAFVPRFAVNDLLAGRFRIVRFIAKGGMGEVYEAVDEELSGRVALKTIRPEVAASEKARERFRREILLARQVTHPSICRIYDLVNDERPSGEIVSFLTMELLAGDTLADRVRRVGPFSAEKAAPLVAQMADALEAAHQAGVIHRDFKSSNVMLVTEEDRTRVVVTDFGLAQGAALEPESDGILLTGQAEAVGTPATMSPEQVTGKPVTARSDLYSFGIVLFEMLAGRLPFLGENAMATAVARLREAPPSLRDLDPGIPARVESVVRRCLERQPERRYASAAEVGSAFQSAVRPARVPRTVGVALAGLLCVALLITGLVFARRRPRPEDVPGPGARRSMAVMGFKDLGAGKDTAWISSALSEMLTSELATSDGLRTVPGENVLRARSDLGLSASETFARETLSRLRDRLGTDLVLVGSYLASGNGGLRMNLFIQDARTGETLVTLTEDGGTERLPALVAQSSLRLRRGLGLPATAPRRTGYSTNPSAARAYAEGLTQLRVSEWLAARASLEDAVREDPGFTMAHLALAEALSRLGYDGDARTSAARALELSEGLPREDRVLIEARGRELEGRWDEAIALYQQLRDLYPDDVEHGLRFARAQRQGGRPKDALATLAALRRLPEPLGEDARIDLLESQCASTVGDVALQLSSARKAAARGRVSGERLLVAEAGYQEAMALQDSGDLPAASAAAETARALFVAGGDRAGEARTLIVLANVSGLSGDLARARELNQQALETSLRLSWKAGMSASLNNLGFAAKIEGDLATARTYYQRALDVKRETGDRKGQALQLGNMAALLLDAGDLPAALATGRSALELARGVADRARIGVVLSDLGETLLASGELAEADRTLHESETVLEEIGRKSSLAQTDAALARLAVYRDDVALARRLGEASRRLREETHEKVRELESRLLQAWIEREAGRPAEALKVVLDAAAALAGVHRPDLLTLAALEEARVRNALGQLPEARAALDRAKTLGAGTQRVETRILLDLVSSQVQDAEGHRDEARADLSRAVEAARHASHVPLLLEARIVEARLLGTRLPAPRSKGGPLSEPGSSGPPGGSSPFDPGTPTVPLDGRARGRDTPRLREGELLSSRFRIVAFIARGGMGEVYEAEDQQLRARVALKLLRRGVPGATGTSGHGELKREAFLARAVTHPHIARVFDLFHHEDEKGEDVVFITMELLEGETLLSRVRRGPLSEAEALTIARQIALALAAAHDASVIHGDLKSGNVILSDGGRRAVVTDFGLARGHGVGHPSDALASPRVSTTTQPFVGTPAYVSPEQVAGDSVGPASDLYSLGVVLFEMLTGQLPFEAETPLATAAKRLDEDPPPPRALVPGISRRTERIVLRLLAKHPAERPPSARAVADALAGGPLPRSEPERRRARRWSLAFAALAVLLVAALLFFWTRAPRDAASGGRRTVGVLRLLNLSGQKDVEWMATALPEMLRAELGSTEGLRVASGETTERVRLELALPPTTTLGDESLARLRRALSCDVVILGSYLAGEGDDVRLDLRVLAGGTVKPVVETGRKDALSALVTRLGGRLRETLHVGSARTGPSHEAPPSLPADPLAARLYAEGLSKLRSFDAPGARDLLAKSAAQEPSFALTHEALSLAYTRLGSDEKALDEAGRAAELAAGLPEESRLLVEARLHVTERKPEAAIAAYQRLATLAPDSLEYGLLLATSQANAEKGDDALVTIARLRRLPPPDGEDPRIDLAEASAASALSDMRRRQAAAARAAAKAQASGARFILAEARSREGSALHDLGQPAAAAAAYAEARRLFTELGDRGGAARAAQRMSELLLQQGESGRALELVDESLAIYRELGHRTGCVRSLDTRSRILLQTGDLKGARRAAEEAWSGPGLTVLETLDRDERMALLDLEGGDAAGAAKRFREILEKAPGSLSKDRRLGIESELAMALLSTGGLDEAQRLLSAAHAHWVANGSRSLAAQAAYRLAVAHLARHDPAAAREWANEALAIQEGLSERAAAAATTRLLVKITARQGE